MTDEPEIASFFTFSLFLDDLIPVSGEQSEAVGLAERLAETGGKGEAASGRSEWTRDSDSGCGSDAEQLLGNGSERKKKASFSLSNMIQNQSFSMMCEAASPVGLGLAVQELRAEELWLAVGELPAQRLRQKLILLLDDRPKFG